jgi:hypothetical protein
MPGLMGTPAFEGRVVETDRTLEAKAVAGGLRLEVLATGRTDEEYETVVAADTNTDSPTYVWINQDGKWGEVERTEKLEYDDAGNVTYEQIDVGGTIHTKTWNEYEYRPDEWLMSLRTLTETISYTEGGGPFVGTGQPARLVRMTYDDDGLVASVRVSGTGPLYSGVRAEGRQDGARPQQPRERAQGDLDRGRRALGARDVLRVRRGERLPRARDRRQGVRDHDAPAPGAGDAHPDRR